MASSSMHPGVQGSPSSHHAAAGNRDAFHPANNNIAPVPRSSSLPLSFPRMGASQSKHAPSSSGTASKGITSAAVAGGIKLKRAFAAKRKKTGDGSASSSPASVLSPAPSLSSADQRPTVLTTTTTTTTTSPLSALSSSYYHQAQASSQEQRQPQEAVSSHRNHPPSTPTISLPPVSLKKQLGQSPTRVSQSISNVPGGPSSPRLAQVQLSQSQSQLPLTTASPPPTATTVTSPGSATVSLSPPRTMNVNRSSVIPLSPGITSAVTYISMLDRQEEAMMVKQREKEVALQKEKEREQKEEEQRKQLPQQPQPQRRQLPTPPLTAAGPSSLADMDASSPSTVPTTTISPTPTPTPEATLPTPPSSSSSVSPPTTITTSSTTSTSPPSSPLLNKDSWRKSDSTNSYHTIRPPRPTLHTLNASTNANRASYASSHPSSPSSPSPTATSRPVSWAESFQSARTVVQGQGATQGQGQGRPLSALFVGGGVEKVEEGEEEGAGSDDDGHEHDYSGRRRRSEDDIGESSEESEGESDIGLDNTDTASSVTSASAASSSKAASLDHGSAASGVSERKIVLKRRSMSLGDASPSQYVPRLVPTPAAVVDTLSPKKIKQPSLSISEGVPPISGPHPNPQPKASGSNLRGRLAAWASGSGTSSSSSASSSASISFSSSSSSSLAESQERDLPALPATSPASPMVHGAVFGPGPQSLAVHMWAQGASSASSASSQGQGPYNHQVEQQMNASNGTSNLNLMQQSQGTTVPSRQARQAVFPQQAQQHQQAYSYPIPQRQQQHVPAPASSAHTYMPPPPQQQHQTLNVLQPHPQQPSRSPAISLTSSGFGLARRAVEKMGMGKWGFGSGSSGGGASNSNSAPSSWVPPPSVMASSASTSSVSGMIGRGMTGTPPPLPPPQQTGGQGMSLFGYAIQRVASGSHHSHSGSTSGYTSSSEDKVGKKERKEREKREKVDREREYVHAKTSSSVSSSSIGGGLSVPASPSKRSHALFGPGHGHGHGVAGGSISSAWSMDSSSRNPGEHDSQLVQQQQQQQQEGPSLGRLVRIPMIPVSKVKGGGSGGGGLVFRKELKLCVKDTGVWVSPASASGEGSGVKEKRTKIEGVEDAVSEETLALIKELEEQRRVPALVVRCAQHLLLWGVHEEGLFRLSGMPSHVSKLRAEFDAGADYDMTECNPGDLDPHAVASVFKAYLRELPEPLLTKKLQHEFDAAIKQETDLNNASDAKRTSSSTTAPSTKSGLPSGPKSGLRKPPSLSTFAIPSFTGIPPASASLLATLRSLIQQLPRENKDLARTVVDLIKATAKQSKKTKMPLSNLLLVFCPSLGMMPPLLKVLCEGEGIWDEVVQVAKGKVVVPATAAAVDLEEVIDIRRMTIKPVPQKAKELEDDRRSRVSVDTTSTDRYHASEESAAEEDEEDVASSSASLAIMPSGASTSVDRQKRQRQRRRDASVDMKAAELEMEQELELQRRARRQSEVPTIYMDSRSHLSSSSSLSIAPELTPGAESSSRSFAQMQAPPSPSTNSSSSRVASKNYMKRRSVGLLSLSSFSSTPPLASPAGSSGSPSPGPNSAGRASFPSLGYVEEAGGQPANLARTMRMKKPSLKLLFSKITAGSPTVGGRTISGPILNSEDEDEYGQSSISTPISAVTAPQSSIPGPNASPRLNHKGSKPLSLTVNVGDIDNAAARSRSSSTASSHFPPVLDTPIENPSLEALDGMFGRFDVSPPDTATLMSTGAPTPTLTLASAVTNLVSPPVMRRPVIGRGRRPPQAPKQPQNDSKVSLGSGSSSASSGNSALTSASSVSLASSHHLSLFEDEDEGGQQETMEDWTRSVLLAAADVSIDLDGWEGVGGGERMEESPSEKMHK